MNQRNNEVQERPNPNPQSAQDEQAMPDMRDAVAESRRRARESKQDEMDNMAVDLAELNPEAMDHLIDALDCDITGNDVLIEEGERVDDDGTMQVPVDLLVEDYGYMFDCPRDEVPPHLRDMYDLVAQIGEGADPEVFYAIIRYAIMNIHPDHVASPFCEIYQDDNDTYVRCNPKDADAAEGGRRLTREQVAQAIRKTHRRDVEQHRESNTLKLGHLVKRQELIIRDVRAQLTSAQARLELLGYIHATEGLSDHLGVMLQRHHPEE